MRRRRNTRGFLFFLFKSIFFQLYLSALVAEFIVHVGQQLGNSDARTSYYRPGPPAK